MATHTTRRASFTVLVGSALGFGITLLLTPLITRVFDPHVFGTFATITATASVFVGVSTFRFEILAQRVESDNDARELLRLGLVSAIAWALVASVVAWIAFLIWDINGWWLVTGVLILAGSLQLLGTAAMTRVRNYRRLAVSNFAQGAGLGVLQLLLGLYQPTVGALVVGFGTARLAWLPSLRGTFRRGAALATWREHWRFGRVAGTSGLVNSVAGQVPILLTAVLYGDHIVGQLAIAIRILVAPLGIVGQAVASANLGEIGRLLREHDPAAARWVKAGMRDLFLLGLIPCAIAGGLGSWLVPIVLGSEWRESGSMVAVLSIGALAQFTAAPFSQLLNVAGRNAALMTWDVARLVTLTVSILVPWTLGLPPIWAIATYSALLVALYIALGRIVIRAVAAPVE